MRKKIIKNINFLQLLKQRGEIRINKKKTQAFEKIYLSGEAYVFEMLVNLKFTHFTNQDVMLMISCILLWWIVKGCCCEERLG